MRRASWATFRPSFRATSCTSWLALRPSSCGSYMMACCASAATARASSNAGSCPLRCSPHLFKCPVVPLAHHCKPFVEPVLQLFLEIIETFLRSAEPFVAELVHKQHRSPGRGAFATRQTQAPAKGET
ncbi:hypothetical protein PCASD_02495 [Puccinia coronata f. sp. avenae]|uniref:Uncharacterized protein n=1 Tax=Puccinia coronata f. sp. avenae TaxID=200324 RepID=A0A2N5VM99_9BASI|nr:hypothetical protein PCASD_02495 [Puccinia coronata f. sp. avenae]